jgi:hypothetical protein
MEPALAAPATAESGTNLNVNSQLLYKISMGVHMHVSRSGPRLTQKYLCLLSRPRLKISLYQAIVS